MVAVWVNPMRSLVIRVQAHGLLRRSGLSADEVKGWLGELLKLSKVENRSDAERERVEELCRLLRGTARAMVIPTCVRVHSSLRCFPSFMIL